METDKRIAEASLSDSAVTGRPVPDLCKMSRLREIPIHAAWLFLATVLAAGLPPMGCSHAPGAGRASSSDSLGLVLLDCEIKWRELIPIALKVDPDAAFLMDLQQDRKPLLGKRKDGILVFRNVPPSLYRLIRVDEGYKNESNEKYAGLTQLKGDVFEFKEDNDLLISVSPGAAVYLGRLLIKGIRPCVLDMHYGNVLSEDLIQLGWGYKMQRSREREIWSRALGKKWSGPWATQIRAHLAGTE